MLTKHKFALAITLLCFFCSFLQIAYKVQQFDGSVTSVRIETDGHNFDFPDIVICVPINNNSLNGYDKIPITDDKNLDNMNFISNFTIMEIRKMLRPELFSFKVSLETSKFDPQKIPRYIIKHYIDGNEIYIKIKITNLEHYENDLLVIAHNLSFYSLLFTEIGTFDRLYYPRHVIHATTTYHSYLLISLQKNTNVILKPPEGPGCFDITFSDYIKCKLKSVQQFNETFDFRTIVELDSSEYSRYRYYDYLSSLDENNEIHKECYSLFRYQFSKCHDVEYKASIKYWDQTQSNLSFYSS